MRCEGRERTRAAVNRVAARVGYAAARMRSRPPQRSRRTISAGPAALVALTLAACGSGSAAGNGVASRTPDAIVTQATKAIDGASSVRVSGAVADGSSKGTIKLDLNLVAGRGATGSISENGLSFRLITIGDNAYVNGSPDFWRQFGGSAAVKRLQGRWLHAPADTGPFQSFASLTNLHTLLAGLLSGHGALTKGAASTLRGQKVVALNDASGRGTLYVATTGKPYPVRILKRGSSGGQLDFGRFDRPVTLAPPHHPIDSTTLGK